MFSFSKSRRALAVLLVLPFLAVLQGCNEGAAIATVATIGLIGGAVTVGNYNNDYYYDCNGYYGCGNYDRRGYYHGNGRGYGRYGYYNRISTGSVDGTNQQEEKVTEDLNNTAAFAARYGITMKAASTLKHALRTTVESQSLQPIYDLGLSSADLQNIADDQEITNKGLKNVSSKLGLSMDQARAAVKQMSADAQNSQN